MPIRISDATRREIHDALSSLDLWGRLDEVQFLDRLYDLDGMPSHDPRFDNARWDILQHRYNRADWKDDWKHSKTK